MTWFKVDDSFHSHPKAAAASLAALGLWGVAGSWCGDHLTDGFVPDHMVTLLARGQAELADELVRAGLWKKARGGYRFHEWTQRNPTRQEVETERARKAEAGRRGGLASAKSRSKRQAGAEARAKAGASRVLPEVPNPRPDPTPSFYEGGSGDARHASRGAARAPHTDTHAPPTTDPDNPDWRTRPAFGAPRDPAEAERTRARAAAARAAIPTRTRSQPTGPTALEQLTALADQIAPQDTEP